jgi:tripartite-type tricarboxylate transporter receptor subunit TctC
MNHLATEMFKMQAGINLTHVPYRGAPLAAVDVISGRVPILFDYMLTGLANIRDGKLRALAVTGDQRSPLLPDVPTMAELGFPDFNASLWFAFFAPSSTPGDMIDKVARAAIDALNRPAVIKRINELGVEVVAEGADELKARLAADRARWKSVIQKLSTSKE